MVDFAQMPPVDMARRIEKLRLLTKLRNGAKFEFFCLHEWRNIKPEPQPVCFKGRYLDYTGEWVYADWDLHGRFVLRGQVQRDAPEFNIDWQSVNA